MRIVASIFAMGALVLAARSAGAEEAISPPPGWEVPPVAPEPKEKPAKEKKAVGPACCAFDQTCCSRQADIDKAVRPRVAVRIIDVRAADLPEAMLKEAAEGEPPIEGAPPVRLINEQGQPFPWSSPPTQIRMLPPGPIGELAWNSEWPTPCFDEEELRGLGWGEIHNTSEKGPYHNDAEITGKVEYVSITQGEGDKLLIDIVKGKVLGSPAIKATYYQHVEAMNVADKVVHAYRVTTKDKGATTTWVNFLLPEVIEGFESPDAKHQGGFFPSRFSRHWSYSLYRLPYGPGRSNLATFRLDDDQKRRWIGVAKTRAPKVMSRNMVVSVSQTAAESEPRVRVMFFEDFVFSFF